MKIKKLLAIALFLTAITTAMFADSVTVDYDHSANFKKINTYSWSNIHTANSIWDQRVKDAIDQQLAAKGWMQVASGGDVKLVAVEKTSVQQQYETLYDGVGGWRRWGGLGETTPTVNNYKVGTLIVSVLSGNSNQLIWRGVSSGTLSGDPNKNTKQLDKDVQKMFKKFPPPAVA